MGGFAGLTSSDSKTFTTTSNPVNNSDNGSVSKSNFAKVGKGATVAMDGSIVIKNVGKGSFVSFESTDHGAVQSANSALMAAINSQAGITRESVMGLNELAETKVTDGANLNTKTTQLGVVIFGLLGAVLAVVWFFRR